MSVIPFVYIGRNSLHPFTVAKSTVRLATPTDMNTIIWRIPVIISRILCRKTIQVKFCFIESTAFNICVYMYMFHTS